MRGFLARHGVGLSKAGARPDGAGKPDLPGRADRRSSVLVWVAGRVMEVMEAENDDKGPAEAESLVLRPFMPPRRQSLAPAAAAPAPPRALVPGLGSWRTHVVDTAADAAAAAAAAAAVEARAKAAAQMQRARSHSFSLEQKARRRSQPSLLLQQQQGPAAGGVGGQRLDSFTGRSIFTSAAVPPGRGPFRPAARTGLPTSLPIAEVEEENHGSFVRDVDSAVGGDSPQQEATWRPGPSRPRPGPRTGRQLWAIARSKINAMLAFKSVLKQEVGGGGSVKPKMVKRPSLPKRKSAAATSSSVVAVPPRPGPRTGRQLWAIARSKIHAMLAWASIIKQEVGGGGSVKPKMVKRPSLPKRKAAPAATSSSAAPLPPPASAAAAPAALAAAAPSDAAGRRRPPPPRKGKRLQSGGSFEGPPAS